MFYFLVASFFFFSYNAKRQRRPWAATSQTERFPRGRWEVEISTAKWLSWFESTSALTTRAVSAACRDDRSGRFLPSFTHCTASLTSLLILGYRRPRASLFAHSPLTFTVAIMFSVRGSITRPAQSWCQCLPSLCLPIKDLLAPCIFLCGPRCSVVHWKAISILTWCDMGNLRGSTGLCWLCCCTVNSPPLCLPLKQEQTVMIYGLTFYLFIFLSFYLLIYSFFLFMQSPRFVLGCYFLLLFFLGKQVDMQSTADVPNLKSQGNISSWPLDEMDWAVLQEIGMINPSLNMNLNELILGILVLMYALSERIIQRIKVMALGRCCKTKRLQEQEGESSRAECTLLCFLSAGMGTAAWPQQSAVWVQCCDTHCLLQPQLGGFRLRMCSSCQGESFLSLSAVLVVPLATITPLSQRRQLIFYHWDFFAVAFVPIWSEQTITSFIQLC